MLATCGTAMRPPSPGSQTKARPLSRSASLSAAGASRSSAWTIRASAASPVRPCPLAVFFILTPCFLTVANRSVAAIVPGLFEPCRYGYVHPYHDRAAHFHHGDHVFSADPAAAAAGQKTAREDRQCAPGRHGGDGGGHSGPGGESRSPRRSRNSGRNRRQCAGQGAE